MSAPFLLVMVILAVGVSNSPLAPYYQHFFHGSFSFSFLQMNFKGDLLFFINEGLMTLFFLSMGLEIKYELLKGALNSPKKAALPVFAALGGMMVPALIYVMINYHDSACLRGWAVPTATDIAFALCALSLLGAKVSPVLKTFLTALAILDDLFAIIIIAFFYTEHIAWVFLVGVLLCCFLLYGLNRAGVSRLSIYLGIGLVCWLCLLKSGVHATLAGVILAAMIPLRPAKKNNSIASGTSLAQQCQQSLHLWIALIIVPLFAFANAGVSFLNLKASTVHISILLGSFLGLFLGKQLGVFGAVWFSVKLHWAALPDRLHLGELYAVALMCGIGFTISLFIGSLAFGSLDESYLNSMKIGVFAGSLLSGIAGYFFFRYVHE